MDFTIVKNREKCKIYYKLLKISLYWSRYKSGHVIGWINKFT